MDERFLALPTWDRLQKQQVIQQLGSIEGQRMIDFGSGAGFLANYYAEKNSVVAIEPNTTLRQEFQPSYSFEQRTGSLDCLKELPSASQKWIICHNVLEYVPNRAEILQEFERILVLGGYLSLVKHNRNGRILQQVVLLNEFEQARALLAGRDSTSAAYGTIHYYPETEVNELCPTMMPIKRYGLRTFYCLQQDQSYQTDLIWQQKMLKMEQEVAGIRAFQEISFLHHFIFQKK